MLSQAGIVLSDIHPHPLGLLPVVLLLAALALALPVLVILLTAFSGGSIAHIFPSLPFAPDKIECSSLGTAESSLEI